MNPWQPKALIPNDAVTTTRGGPIFTDSRWMCGERGGCGSEEHEEHEEHDEHTHTTRKVKARLLSPVANRSNPALSRGARLEGTLEPNR